ncbi:hypothetical protein [Paenibacillus sp. LK1]|uniref:hypothetical protein n=1 Tax=Paenibacillus sp. LK1 TaxID=2053014 RepID=UPI000C1A3026|nr:hypothetical protein [Paenibacillus sp. LK1]PIH59074.1 hypothetical protein CS562_14115 [Paenibacillus sp. LK1]
MLTLEYYYNLSVEELKVVFDPFTKEQLLKFAEETDTPVKSYLSEKKIRNHIINQIHMTGIYRRIAFNKSE